MLIRSYATLFELFLLYAVGILDAFPGPLSSCPVIDGLQPWALSDRSALVEVTGHSLHQLRYR